MKNSQIIKIVVVVTAMLSTSMANAAIFGETQITIDHPVQVTATATSFAAPTDFDQDLW